jgi:hypothetical protein
LFGEEIAEAHDTLFLQGNSVLRLVDTMNVGRDPAGVNPQQNLPASKSLRFAMQHASTRVEF